MFGEALPFIERYVNELSEILSQISPGGGLSKSQEKWLKFCLMGILITNSIQWSNFFRASLGRYKISALSWMFRHSKIFWERILQASIMLILKKFNITEGVLVLDDTDKKRSKKTKRIHLAHKVYDKGTGGYFNGQSLVVLVLVTNKITIPIGFGFYCPKKLAQELGIPPKSKLELGVGLLNKFKNNFPKFKVKAVLADALYGPKYFADQVTEMFPKSQFISQLKCNQLVWCEDKKISLKKYFGEGEWKSKSVKIRGQSKKIEYKGARLKVFAHGKKRAVVAMRYEGESECRYIYATKMTWRVEDIVETYGFRWLVEVFIQDCKSFEGLGELQLLDDEGSERAVALSFLFDCSLFFHEEQTKLIESKLPAYTVGSLLRKSRIDAFVFYLKSILNSDNPLAVIDNIEAGVKSIYNLRISKKHMAGMNLGPTEPLSGSSQCVMEEVPMTA